MRGRSRTPCLEAIRAPASAPRDRRCLRLASSAELPRGSWTAINSLTFRTSCGSLLNAWDPIGVADVVDDEYDCLIGPILTKLSAGATAVEMSEFVWFELADHLGLDPSAHAADRFGASLVAWFAAKSRSAGG